MTVAKHVTSCDNLMGETFRLAYCNVATADRCAMDCYSCDCSSGSGRAGRVYAMGGRLT